jgi:hypothetical protein
MWTPNQDKNDPCYNCSIVQSKNNVVSFIPATGNEEVLNQVDLPILDDSVCANEFPVYLTNNELCAGYKNQGKDWCAVSI